MVTQQEPARFFAMVFATSLHLAIGWALLSSAEHGRTGPSPKVSASEPVLTIELIPLDQLGIDTRNSSLGGKSDHSGDAKPIDPLPTSKRGIAKTSLAKATPELGKQAGGHEIADASSRAAVAITELPDTEVAAYRARLQAHLARYRIYPAAARTEGKEGIVTLRFIMTANGQVTDAWIEASSGEVVIDQEALDAISRAQPLPPPPSGWPDRLDIGLSVSFHLG